MILKNLGISSLLFVAMVFLLRYYLSETEFTHFSTKEELARSVNLIPLIASLIFLSISIFLNNEYILFFLFFSLPIHVFSIIFKIDGNYFHYEFFVYYSCFLLFYIFWDKIYFIPKLVHQFKINKIKMFAVLILFYHAFLFYNFTPSFDFEDVYTTRFAAREYGRIFSYGMAVIQGAVIPYLLFYFFKTNKFKVCLLAFFLAFIMLVFSGVRYPLFISVLAVSFFLFLKIGSTRAFLNSFLLVLNGCLVLGIVSDLEIVHRFIRRFILTTGHLAFLSYDFNYMGYDTLARELGHYFRGKNTNANMNPFSIAVHELSWYVSLAFMFLGSFMLVLIKRYTHFSILFVPIGLISHLRLQSWYLTGGIFVLLVLVMVFEGKKNK